LSGSWKFFQRAVKKYSRKGGISKVSQIAGEIYRVHIHFMAIDGNQNLFHFFSLKLVQLTVALYELPH
jgi:hypothetical protein